MSYRILLRSYRKIVRDYYKADGRLEITAKQRPERNVSWIQRKHQASEVRM